MLLATVRIMLALSLTWPFLAGGAHAETSPINKSVNIELVISPKCTITPPGDLSFPAANFGSNFGTRSLLAGQTQLTVTCTPGSPYSITLNSGAHSQNNGTQRYMSRTGASELAQYQLYQDQEYTIVWGLIPGLIPSLPTTNEKSATGTGEAQAYPIYGTVAKSVVEALRPGDYTDLIGVTVTY